ncbi:MAG TPA: hypothetical protein VMB80_08775 [Candidatus Acidoferrum sp.]|nr:hypothetical protein [Candidatus Acidoferrum sp.]
MSAQNLAAAAPIPDGKWLYRAGGIAAFVLVVGYLLTFPVYAWVGDAPPNGVEARLAYFAKHATGWWMILGLMVFTDLLYVPIFLSLYRALKAVSRNGMLLAVACQGLFVVLDLALTWTAYSTLLTLGRHYAAATTDVQRAALVAAAGYPCAMLDSPLLGVCVIVIPSLGFLITGLVMLRGVFNKTTACLALTAGITGIAFMGSYIVGALAMLRIVNALLVTVWYGFVGWKLCRLGK